MNLLESPTGEPLRSVRFQLRSPSSTQRHPTPRARARARVFVFESVKPPEGERISAAKQMNERGLASIEVIEEFAEGNSVYRS